MTDNKPWTEVVAGVLYNDAGQFLLSSRPEGKAYAGYWEFAGGKVEPGETEFAALQREFQEELGIDIVAATPWLTKRHRYEHANVCLRFYKIQAWQGNIQALENQDYCWQDSGALTVEPMLPANAPILKGLALPTVLQGNLTNGLAGHNSRGHWAVVPVVDVDNPPEQGLLQSAQLQQLQARPVAMQWAVAEVASDADVAHAQALGMDAMVCTLNDAAAVTQVQAWLSAGCALPLIGLVARDVDATELLALGLQALVPQEPV
ncbi:MAG: NUDIX domain-containing protein [Neisseriaceae bacterium]|nr:NUDIX domain-containing protein [Neisseriaceae bacterium]